MLSVTIIGAGAIGRLYGGWLAKGGARVSFLLRPSTSNAFETLDLIGPSGRETITLAAVSSDPAALPPADAIVIATKLYDLEEAAARAAAIAGPETVVLGLQNGVTARDTLRRHLPADRILVGAVYSPAVVTGPAAVTYPGGRNSVVIGGAAHPVAPRLVDAWRAAGVDAAVADDIAQVLWRKYLALVTNAALTTLTRLPARTVYHDDGLRALARQSIVEALAVGRAEGVALTDADGEAAFDFLAGLPAETVASMRQDLDAGRRLELDAFSGHLVRRAAARGLEVPFHRMAHACLRPYRDGRPG